MVIDVSRYPLDHLHPTKKFKSNSWFEIVRHGDRTPHIASTPKDQPKGRKGKIIRMRGVQLFPTDDQKNCLIEWMKIYRIVYNMTINYIRTNNLVKYTQMEEELHGDFSDHFNFIVLKSGNKRNYVDKEVIVSKVRGKFSRILSSRITISKIPSATVRFAIWDAISMFESASANLKRGHIKKFRLRYRKVDCSRSVITLAENTYRGNNMICTSLKCFKNTPLDTKVPLDIHHSYKIMHDGKWTILCPFLPQLHRVDANNNVCSIDLGVRNFASVYSKDTSYKFGVKPCKRLDSIIKRTEVPRDKFNCYKKFKKYNSRNHTKLHNVVKDMHYKVAKTLCNRFKTILVGKLSTKGIVKKSNKMSKMNKLRSYALSFYRFREILKDRAKVYGNIVHEVHEYMTSRMCMECQRVNKPHAGEVFHCKRIGCGFTLHRDIHGARNIMIKHFNEDEWKQLTRK